MTGARKNSGYVQSIERAMSIIEVLDEHGELGISEISDELGLEPSTVHRIVSTLKGLGYVNQNRENHKYSNSFKLFEIGNNVVKSLCLKKQAMPFMRELSDKTNEAVNLAVMDGKYVIYIDKIESQSTIRVDLSVGKRMPTYCTGLGKIMLAYMPETKVRELLEDEPFVRFTKNTVPDLETLFQHLARIRKQGYCIDNEEYIEGLFCVAAPVWGHSGEVLAALSVAVPKFLYADTERLFAIRDLVIDVAKRFSTTLGYKS